MPVERQNRRRPPRRTPPPPSRIYLMHDGERMSRKIRGRTPAARKRSRRLAAHRFQFLQEAIHLFREVVVHQSNALCRLQTQAAEWLERVVVACPGEDAALAESG